jgi:hypothetical protein
MRATISGFDLARAGRICVDFSSSSSAHCHFRPDPAASPGDRGMKIRTFTGKKSAAESRFCKGSKSAFERLEIHAKNPIYSTTCC